MADQRLHLVNLIVPATAAKPAPAAVLSSHWTANLVVADEDRAASGHFGEPVRHPGNLAPHAALALATAAGLWRGMSGGPFDDDLEGAGEQVTRVRVTRSFARTVCSYGLVDAVANEMLTRRGVEDWIGVRLNATAAKDPARLVMQAAEEHAGGAGRQLALKPYQNPAQAPTLIGILDAFKLLRREIPQQAWESMRELRRGIAQEARSRIAEFFQGFVFGPDSTMQVTLGARTFTTTSEPLGADSQEFAQALLDRLGQQPEPPGFQDTWRDLRALAFGLAEAGELPEGCRTPLAGPDRVIITDMHAICPDPDGEAFEVPPAQPPEGDGAGQAPQTVGPCDPAAARHARRLLRSRAAEAAGDDNAKGADPQLDRFERWLDERRASLLWRIGDRLVTDAESAQRALANTLRRAQKGPGEGEPVKRRGWLTLALASLAGLALAVVASQLSVPWQITGTIALVTLIGSLLRAFFILNAERKLKYRRDAALHEYRDAVGGAEHWARELIRLHAAYEQYQDWATIIGRILHRPAGAGHDPSDAMADLRNLAMPAAMDLAVGDTNSRVPDQLVGRVGDECFWPGWISSLFLHVREQSMRRLRSDRGLPEDAVLPNPDVDPGARRRLVEDVTGQAGEWGRAWLRDKVRAGLTDLGPSQWHSRLVDPGDPDRTVTGSAEEFLTAIHPERLPTQVPEVFGRALWVAKAEGVDPKVSKRGWAPEAIVCPDESVAVHQHDPTPSKKTSMLVLQTVRLDATEPVPWPDLVLFHDDLPEPPKSPTDLGGRG